MNAGIFFNRNYIADNLGNIDRIRSRLEMFNADCRIVEVFGDIDGLDVLFVLGGDGTILTVAAECAKRGVKIVGINYGHLGFLAEFKPDEIDFAVDLACKGDYGTTERSMLNISFNGSSFLALNDLVIQRSTSGVNFSNTVDLRAEINGSTVDNFSSDGIIVSTPTGSTAYSLSAGGSILVPELNAFIMTPICAHSLHSRPVVYCADSVLEIFPLSARTPLNVIVDGRIVGIIDNAQTVKIKKAACCASFITRNDKDFFKELLIKLNIWSK